MLVNVRRSSCLWAFCCLFLCALPAMANEGVRLSKWKSGESDVLRLSLPEGLATSWQEANVGRVLIRTPGRQVQLNSDRLTKSAYLDLKPETQGCSMIQVDVGPPSSKGRSDSWRRMTHCTKIIECFSGSDLGSELEARHSSSHLMTNKVGSRIEIRPLLSPALLRPGSTMPLRLYLDGGSAQGALVEALGPDDQIVSGRTDSVGITALEIPSAGRWTVRFSADSGGIEHLAELIFEVPTSEVWQAMEGALQ